MPSCPWAPIAPHRCLGAHRPLLVPIGPQSSPKVPISPHMTPWAPSGYRRSSKVPKSTNVSPYTHILRRHKLPTPHLALWPTEVHVVMRGKVCEKGCYFLGTQTPLVATCKNKVCISNICHYLHFWKHTDFQNKDVQSPKYSVVLHLDHCIPVCGGGGGLPIFLSPLFEVDHRTPLYTTDEGTPNIPFIEAHRKLSQSMYLYLLF